MSLRIIQVGLGGRGAHWLDFLARRDDVQIVACVDASPKVLESARARPTLAKAQCFDRLDAAFGAVPADFALIASPSSLHAAHTLQALEAGLAVLVEKPFGMTLAEAIPVARRARQLRKPVVVAENYRFFQAEQTLRTFLASGIAGAVRSAYCIDRRDQSSSTQGPWVKSMPYPFLTEIGVHHFDSFRFLFGAQPKSILAESYNPTGSDYDHEGAANALIELENGVTLQYSGTFVASRYEFELLIEAENGDVRTDRVRVWWRENGRNKFSEVPAQPLPPGEVLRYPEAGMTTILNQFCRALREGVPAETNGEDNLWTLAMLEAAVRSVREGRSVPISEVFSPAQLTGHTEPMRGAG